MNLLDLVLIVILAYCLVRGGFRGIVKELSSIIGVLAGLYAAYAYYPLLAQSLSRWATNFAYLNIISCFIIFIIVYLGVSYLGVLIKYFLDIACLGWTDRLCGVLFGTLKGILISAVLILVLTTFLPKKSDILRESVTARNIMTISATLISMAPRDMKKLFSVKMKELNKAWHSKKL
ncbi:MAG: CvpA family protein [Desulfobacteraceae bacterium]|nr:CvpA family protein [Desulfobacteraceae bacterium]